MGYDLTITKKENPNYEEGNQISHAEWFDYVETHPHLKISKSMTPSSDSEYVVWGDSRCWLSWSKRSIDSKNPDGNFVEQMISIADALGAKVLGEESEQYLANERGYVVHSEKGKFLADWSTAKNENGVVSYEFTELEPPIKKHRSKEDQEKLLVIEKELRKLAEMKKSMNRPWWKFW